MGIFSIGGQPLTGPNNSYNSPFAMNNMQGEGWGVDPSDLTPSYAAGYRPQGQEAPINSQRHGFWESANNQFNPFATQPYKFSNPFEAQQPFRESLAPRAGDAAMFITQVGVGVGAYEVGNKIWKGINYAGVAKGSAAGFMQGNAARMGGRFTGGLAKGIMGSSFTAGMPFTAEAAIGGATTAGRVVGGIAGGFAGMGIAQAGISTFNYAVADPYINQRGTARDLRENFSGVTFGGGYGDPYHGRGLSFSASNRIASDITKGGFGDYTFSGADIKGIADKSSRLGLLDNVDPSKFAQQVKDIAKQTAIIASIANFVNDPENIESLKIIAKFKDAGISIKDSAKAFAALSGHASVAGISSSRMMEHAAQGQFMFSANGMTPGEGINRYASSFASFAAAKRNGLISDGLLARLGGPEGAAQASMTGMINASQTPYNQMILANRYLGRGAQSGGITTDLGRFGGLFAEDPLGAMGALGMYGNHMAEAQLKEQGPLAMQTQIMNIAKQLHMLNKDGTLDIHKAHLLATSPMIGMSNDSATSALIELMNASDPKQYQNMLDGINSNYAKNRASLMDAAGSSGWAPYAKWKNQTLRPLGRDLKIAGSIITDPIADGFSYMADGISNWKNELDYGSQRVDGRGPMLVTDLMAEEAKAKKRYKTLEISNSEASGSISARMGAAHMDFAKKINEASKRDNDTLVNEYLSAKDSKGRQAAISKMREANHPAIEGVSDEVLSQVERGFNSGKASIGSKSSTDIEKDYSMEIDDHKWRTLGKLAGRVTIPGVILASGEMFGLLDKRETWKATDDTREFIRRINAAAKSRDAATAAEAREYLSTKAEERDAREAALKKMKKRNPNLMEGLDEKVIYNVEKGFESGDIKAKITDAEIKEQREGVITTFNDRLRASGTSYEDILKLSDENVSDFEKGRIKTNFLDKGVKNSKNSIDLYSAIPMAAGLDKNYREAVKKKQFTGTIDEFAKTENAFAGIRVDPNLLSPDRRLEDVGAPEDVIKNAQKLRRDTAEEIAKLNKARSENRISGGDYFAKMAMASADKMNEAADKMLKAAGIKTPVEQAIADREYNGRNWIGRAMLRSGGYVEPTEDSRSAGNPTKPQAPQPGNSASRIGAR